MIFRFFSNKKGYTLIEVLVSMILAALIFAGSLMIVRNIRAVDSGFEEMAGLYAEIGKINRVLREDLAGIQKSVNMEPFTDGNGDGFFNGTETLTPADDPSTLRLPYAPTVNRDESANPPGNDPATPYDESATDSGNLPYGPAYDYFIGITDNGLRDVLSFRGSVLVGGEARPAMITYRLVERSHQCNGDTGTDGLSDEFEPGYHPLYHPDPNNDNVSGVFNPGQFPLGRVETEGDGIIDVSFSCPDVGAKPLYQLQRIIALAPGEIVLEVISTSVVEFNVLYYDPQKQYVEPPSLIKRFGYPIPEDGTSTGTFDSAQLFTYGVSGDRFLNVKVGDAVYLEQGSSILPGLYIVTEAHRLTPTQQGLRFDLAGQIPNSAPATFRAPYLPAAIKIVLTVKANLGPVSDPRSLLRTISMTIFLGGRM